MNHEQLLKTVAQVANRPVAKLHRDTMLNSLGLSTSLGLTLLRSAIERKLGVRVPPLKWNHTIGDVESLLRAAPVEKSTSIESRGEPTRVGPRMSRGSPEHQLRRLFQPGSDEVKLVLNGVGLGTDLEEVGNLPEAADLRSHPFFQSNFSEREIATALLRPDPRQHLCGLFCAKEAVKKADPQLLNLRMDEIEILHEAGRPIVRFVDVRLASRFQTRISISHTKQFAMASALVLQMAEALP